MNDTNMYTEQVSTQAELPPPAPTPAQPAQILYTYLLPLLSKRA